MSITGKWVMWGVVLVVVVGGLLWWYLASQNANPYGSAQTGSLSAGNGSLQTSPTDTSDGALNQDTATIDTQMNGLNSDSAAINQGMNDQPVPQGQ